MNFTVGKNSKDWGEREVRELKTWQETCFEIQCGPWQTFLLRDSDPRAPVESRNRCSQAEQLLPGHLVCSVVGEAQRRGPSCLYAQSGADLVSFLLAWFISRQSLCVLGPPQGADQGQDSQIRPIFFLFHNGRVGRLWTAIDKGEKQPSQSKMNSGSVSLGSPVPPSPPWPLHIHSTVFQVLG